MNRRLNRRQESKPAGGKVPLRRDLTRREPLGRTIERGGSSKLGILENCKTLEGSLRRRQLLKNPE